MAPTSLNLNNNNNYASHNSPCQPNCFHRTDDVATLHPNRQYYSQYFLLLNTSIMGLCVCVWVLCPPRNVTQRAAAVYFSFSHSTCDPHLLFSISNQILNDDKHGNIEGLCIRFSHNHFHFRCTSFPPSSSLLSSSSTGRLMQRRHVLLSRKIIHWCSINYHYYYIRSTEMTVTVTNDGVIK